MSINSFSQIENIANEDGNRNREFPPGSKEAVSLRFLELLSQEKKWVDENFEQLLSGLVSDESVDAFRDLAVFSRALQLLVNDPVLPESKIKGLLKLHLMSLDPVGSREIIPGINSYALAVKNVLDILREILNPGIFAKLAPYLEKIFVAPAQDYWHSSQQNDL